MSQQQNFKQKNIDEQLKLSFIMPVYNGAEYIRRSVDSVLREKEINFELLIIDDGSTDDTRKLLEQIAKEDSRVKVFYTENRGQSLARNTGIDAASGDYIAFVDADDVLLWNGMRQLFRIAAQGNWDVVCGNYYQIYKGRRRLGMSEGGSGEIIHDDVPRSLYQQIRIRNVFGYCWNKLYSADFLEANNLSFDDVRKVYMEDSLFNHKAFANNPSFYFCNTPVYEYYMLEQSSSRCCEPDIAVKYAYMLDDYQRYLKQKNLYEANIDLITAMAMRVFCWSMVRDIPFYGMPNKKNLNDKIDVYINCKSFSELLSDTVNVNTLDLIPSLTQRIIFKACFRMLCSGRSKMIPGLIRAGYPMIKFYMINMMN